MVISANLRIDGRSLTSLHTPVLMPSLHQTSNTRVDVNFNAFQRCKKIRTLMKPLQLKFYNLAAHRNPNVYTTCSSKYATICNKQLNTM